jgi:hypothetical protein
MRGFPKTTLSTPLDLILVAPATSGGATPTFVSNADVEVKSDLPGASFAPDDGDKTSFQPVLHLKTNAVGRAHVRVWLADHPGQGKITITASANGQKQTCAVSLESIDEKIDLPTPQNVHGDAGPTGTGVQTTWSPGGADNHTAYIVSRKESADRPWRAIAIVPENVTTYLDNDVIIGRSYYYGVAATNESKWGYPPRLVGAPNRLDDLFP